MGILLCEQNFRNVWIRNESVRAEIGQILHPDTHPHQGLARNGNFFKNAVINIFFTVTSKMTQLHIFAVFSLD